MTHYLYKICFFRFVSDYSLKINVKGENVSHEAEFTKCVGEYFDTNGVLLMDIFEPEVMNLYKNVSVEKKNQ